MRSAVVSKLSMSAGLSLMKCKPIVSFLLTLLFTAAVAQEVPGPQVDVRMKLISLEGPILAQGYRKGRTIVPLVIAPDFFSEEIVYKGPARFELVPIKPKGTKASDDPTKATKGSPPRNANNKGSADFEAKSDSAPTAWVNLPTTPGPHHLILLVATGKPEGGISVIEDTPGSFPYGSWRFFNLCPYHIELQTGKTLTKIAPRSSGVIKSGVEEGSYFDGEIFTFENGERRSGYSFHALQQDDTRFLYFVTPGPPDTGQTQIKGVQDRKGAGLTGPPPGAASAADRKGKKK